MSDEPRPALGAGATLRGIAAEVVRELVARALLPEVYAPPARSAVFAVLADELFSTGAVEFEPPAKD